MSGRLAGVVGWPVSQSLSPLIHKYWLKQYGIDGAYIALPIAPENFARCVTVLPLMGFAGVNVTVPHKQAAADLSDTRDDDTHITGAANLLVFRDGRVIGANSDVYGFLENLKQTIDLSTITTRHAVVLGAGGAARGVILALHRAGFREIRIFNRTKERAQQVADHFGDTIPCHPMNWGDWSNAFIGAGLVVNTTSLGMVGKPPLVLQLDSLPKTAVVADIVYNPVQTPLLRHAGDAGHPVIDGLGMLMHQAVPAFASWFGVEPAVTAALRSLLIKALSDA